MSSFRRPKTEASLRLYSLPRRELQALCKQYGIPANKTNVAMAEALSSCVPADFGKSKASVGPNSLGVSKTTIMKPMLEKKIGLPETSLASFILTGKRKETAVEKPIVADEEEAVFPKPNTTPLKRGVKRPERPLQTLHDEKAKVAAVPAFTRANAAAFQDRVGKAAPAVTSPKPPGHTPRKRPAEAAAIVTRRGGDHFPPVSFCDLVATPKKSEPLIPEIIHLNSTGKAAKKMKSKLGLGTGPHEEEATLPLSQAAGAARKVSKGKRVAFADEVELNKRESRESEPQPEPGTETMDISCAYIELKNAALHKELLGLHENNAMQEEQGVSPVLTEEPEHKEHDSESKEEAVFEFMNMALHKELFGRQRKKERKSEELVRSSHDFQQGGASPSAIQLESPESKVLNSPASSAPDIFIPNSTPAEDLPAPSSINEDLRQDSDSKGGVFEVHTERNLLLGRDLSPILEEVSWNTLTDNRCEKITELPDSSHANSTACSLGTTQSDTKLIFEQEPTVISSSADVPLTVDQGKGSGGIQRRQSGSHDVPMVVDDQIDNSFEKNFSEETHVSPAPVVDEDQKVLTAGFTLTFNDVQRSPQGPVSNEKSEASPIVTSEKRVVTADLEIVMSKSIPATSFTETQDHSDSNLAEAVTPLTKVQNNIGSTLAKATSILQKLAAWREEAEKKVREGYWEPKSSSVVENVSSLPEVENISSAAEAEKPIAKTVLVVDRDLPSAKKARPMPKAILVSEKALVVCEDGSKIEMPSAKKIRPSDESMSEVSDKENQSDKGMDDRRKLGGFGKEKGKKFEVLKDRQRNLPDHVGNENALGTIKEVTGPIRPGDMSLRKLRNKVKEKVSQFEASKASGLRSQQSRNMAH